MQDISNHHKSKFLDQSQSVLRNRSPSSDLRTIRFSTNQQDGDAATDLNYSQKIRNTVSKLSILKRPLESMLNRNAQGSDATSLNDESTL